MELAAGGLMSLILVGILLFLSPLFVWNRLIKMHQTMKRDQKKIIELLERIADDLEGRTAPAAEPPTAAPEPPKPTAAPPPPRPVRVPGKYARKWMS